MPDPRLSKLVRELKSGQDVSNHLKEIWSPSSKNPPSKADSLALAQAVAKIAETLDTRESLRAWHQAILALRRLAVFLKKPKSADPVETVAGIEKYCVNYALRACQTEHDDASVLPSASVVAAETLRLIFECRRLPSDALRPDKARPVARRSRKENLDPQAVLTEQRRIHNHAYRLVFKGAHNIDEQQFLPQNDNVVISSVITGAIAIRVAARCDSLPLPSRLELARKLGVAWADYLSQCPGDKTSLRRRSEAHLTKMKNGLLIAAKEPRRHPVHVLKARAFAITMCETSAEEYSYNALRVVNSFLRRSRREGLSQTEDYEHVAEVYRDAVLFLQNLQTSAATWVNEDVSTLLDHIMSTVARCESLGIGGTKAISRTALSSLLQQRSADLREVKNVPCELFAHAFQERIFADNAYSLFAKPDSDNLGEDASNASHCIAIAMDATLPRGLVPVDKQFRKGPANTAQKAIICKKAVLRLLRILEPHRREICNSSIPLTEDSCALLQLYVILLSAGAQAKARCNCVYAKHERFSEDEVASRVEKMTGAGIEAADKLMSKFVKDGDSEGAQATIQHIDRILSFKSQTGSSWGAWISRRMYNAGLEAYSKHRAQSQDSEFCYETIGEVLLRGVRWLMPEESDECFKKHDHFPDVVNMLVLCIHCYIAGENIDDALIVAAQKLLRSFCFETSCLSTGILPEPVRSNLLRTCGQIAALALQHNCMAEFLEEFCPGEPLSETVRKRLGANFFHALGEYALAVRAGEVSKADSEPSSVALRTNVKAQNEILNVLELPGKCLALQTYQEWTRLLLDGISSGITNSPRILGDTGTICLDNGDNVEVELGPKFCECSICSSDDFVLLNILQGSWRAALHRSPYLLRAELSKLEHFLTTSRLVNIHISLVILSLDFLEWCQVLAILSSIEDTGRLISKMIQACREELNLQSSPYDLVAIYASHGFLAGRPYYSHLLHSGIQTEPDDEEKKDGRWSLIEQEKFMREGCLADFHIQNLDLKSAVTTAKKSLKSLLVKVMSQKYGADRPIFSVGGVDFEMQVDVITARDRARALQIVELIFAMDRLGNINMKLENFNDGVYFLKKAMDLSKTLCGAESLLHRRQKSILYQANLLMLKSQEDIDEHLESELRKVDFQVKNKFDKTVVSDAYAVTADIAISAASLGEIDVVRAQKLGNIADRLLTNALELLEETDGDEVEEGSAEIQINSLISQDISLRSGQAQFLLGNVEKAAFLFNEIRQEVHENRLDTYLNSILGLIRALVGKVGGLEKTRTLINEKAAKTPRGRRTRRTPKNDNTFDVEKIRVLLSEAEQCLEGSYWEPQIRTEVFLMHASILGPASASTGLAWEIGNGFSLQWHLRKESLKPPVIELDPEDELVSRVRAVHVSSEKEQDLQKCQSLLYDMNIIAVGMSLDEDKSGIIFWRISAAGFFSTRLSVPTIGDTSYSSLSSRIKAVFEKMKNNAVKSGDSFTEDQKESWWEKTFELDDEMKEILEDIEKDWFGPCSIFLLPACSSTNDEIAADEMSQAVSALAAIEECYDETVLRSHTKQAFNSLGFGRTSFEKALSSLSALDCAASRVGNTVFILDSHLEHIPFESLPILRKNNVGSTRVPSLAYFIDQLSTVQKRPNPKNVFYVLNPAGDLPRTEKKFRTVFEKRKGWRGVTGNIANNLQISSEMKNAEIFVFCGHGGGEKYVSPRQLGDRRNAPIAVLMGCSSAKLTRRSRYRGSTGTPLEYLLHGAPAVVGNLWDVTDKDIDRLTASFLKQWLGVSASPRRTLGIADSLAVARGACKLPYLVGAATIIYGLPFV